MSTIIHEARPVNKAVNDREVRATARRKTIKTFRRFLDALELELMLYGFGPRQHELSTAFFLYLRRAARRFRDEPKTTHEVGVMTALDLATAWDEWSARTDLSPAVRRLHETLTRTVKGAIKGWRTYLVSQQLSDPPLAAPKPNNPEEKDHGEIRSVDERVHPDQRDESERSL